MYCSATSMTNSQGLTILADSSLLHAPFFCSYFLLIDLRQSCPCIAQARKRFRSSRARDDHWPEKIDTMNEIEERSLELGVAFVGRTASCGHSMLVR